MSRRRKYGASAEIYFESQEQIESFRATAAKQGISLSAYIRQLLLNSSEAN
ncbi:hypothetical protein [uncultured Nostoc sp.]|uniref:hypothetical protein n=1 Tax=uncultured Nostoc sp. TaxID=340711 RepID=UPI0035C98004